jgi:hypothetical protein
VTAFDPSNLPNEAFGGVEQVPIDSASSSSSSSSSSASSRVGSKAAASAEFITVEKARSAYFLIYEQRGGQSTSLALSAALFSSSASSSAASTSLSPPMALAPAPLPPRDSHTYLNDPLRQHSHHRYAVIDRALWTDTRRLMRARQLCDARFAAFLWDCARDRMFVPQPMLAVAAVPMTTAMVEEVKSVADAKAAAVATAEAKTEAAAEADCDRDANAPSSGNASVHFDLNSSGRRITHLDRHGSNADANANADCDPTLITLQTGARFVFGTLCRARVGRGKPLRQWLDHLSVAVTLHMPFCAWLVTEAADSGRHAGGRSWIESTLIDCPDAETREAFAKLFLNAALCLRCGWSLFSQL